MKLELEYTEGKRTERLVSLYLTLMSAAVRRMASIASSSVTRYIPGLAMDNCAAVTAFTATRNIKELAYPRMQ